MDSKQFLLKKNFFFKKFSKFATKTERPQALHQKRREESEIRWVKKFRRGQTGEVLTGASEDPGAIDPAQVRRDEVPRAARNNGP